MAHVRSEEHTSELQSRGHLVCRLLLEKKNNRAFVLFSRQSKYTAQDGIRRSDSTSNSRSPSIADAFLSSHAASSAAIWFFFFNDTATTEIYTLSLHDALPI